LETSSNNQHQGQEYKHRDSKHNASKYVLLQNYKCLSAFDKSCEINPLFFSPTAIAAAAAT